MARAAVVSRIQVVNGRKEIDLVVHLMSRKSVAEHGCSLRREAVVCGDHAAKYGNVCGILEVLRFQRLDGFLHVLGRGEGCCQSFDFGWRSEEDRLHFERAVFFLIFLVVGRKCLTDFDGLCLGVRLAEAMGFQRIQQRPDDKPGSLAFEVRAFGCCRFADGALPALA